MHGTILLGRPAPVHRIAAYAFTLRGLSHRAERAGCKTGRRNSNDIYQSIARQASTNVVNTKIINTKQYIDHFLPARKDTPPCETGLNFSTLGNLTIIDKMACQAVPEGLPRAFFIGKSRKFRRKQTRPKGCKKFRHSPLQPFEPQRRKDAEEKQEAMG